MTTTGILRWETPRHCTTLDDLIQAGLLLVGTILTCRRNGRVARAVVVFDGLYVEGWGLYRHPSPAAKDATGAGSSNGWADWRLPDNRPLDDLREQYEH
jgi:hypothetical protein